MIRRRFEGATHLGHERRRPEFEEAAACSDRIKELREIEIYAEG